MPRLFYFVAVLLCFDAAIGAGILAGVASVNATLPVGVPLAGYNHGARRYPLWPLFHSGQYTNWMMPSTGVLDGTMAKALVIQDENGEYFAVVSVDAIGSSGSLNAMAYDMAVAQGLKVPFENIIFSGSHSHSGPGAIDPSFLWSIAPATDLVIPSLQRQMASYLATALVQAQNNMQPALVGIGMANLTGVTENRRAHLSPYVTSGTIDPTLGLIRVDAALPTPHPLALLWNFAIHGVCYGPENMLISGDIMGRASAVVEERLPVVALFVNSDAGDISPTGPACSNAPNFTGADAIADAVASLWSSITPSTNLSISQAQSVVNFGPTNLNLTLQRLDNCTQGGPLDICSICKVLNCDLNSHLDSAWIENTPRFTGFVLESAGTEYLILSLPGEALVELGWEIRNDTLKLGFERTLLFGYSNNHMGYFATPNEYIVGGYESLLTFWGIDTAERIRGSAVGVARQLVAARKSGRV